MKIREAEMKGHKTMEFHSTFLCCIDQLLPRYMSFKTGFHLCECGRANRATVRRQSREPVARLFDQGPEHAYKVIIAESKQLIGSALPGRKKVEGS